MRVRELPPFTRQSVDIRGLDLRRSVAPDIAVAEIIREDDNNVGLWFACGMQCGEGCECKCCETCNYRFHGVYALSVAWCLASTGGRLDRRLRSHRLCRRCTNGAGIRLSHFTGAGGKLSFVEQRGPLSVHAEAMREVEQSPEHEETNHSCDSCDRPRKAHAGRGHFRDIHPQRAPIAQSRVRWLSEAFVAGCRRRYGLAARRGRFGLGPTLTLRDGHR